MITQLALKNFKSFRDATLKLGPLTVIIGTNASGKSNLRDAFRFLHGIGRGYSLADVIGRKYAEGGVLTWEGIRGGFKEIMFDDATKFEIETWIGRLRPPDVQGIRLAEQAQYSLVLALSNPDSRAMRSMKSSAEGPISSSPRNDFDLRPRVEYENLTDGHAFGYATGAVPLVGDEFDISSPADVLSSGFFLNAPDSSGTLVLAFRLPGEPLRWEYRRGLDIKTPMLCQVSAELIGRENWEVVARAQAQFASMRFFEFSPEAMKTPSFLGQNVLGDRGENLSSVLYEICEEPSLKQSVTDWLQALTPLDVVDIDFDSDPAGRIHLFLREANGRRTSAFSASDGTLRFLGLIAALLGPGSEQLIFIDEIETGIHPTRLHLLLQLIEQQTHEKKMQVVVTTHSPQLLAALSEEAQKWVSLAYRLEDESETRLQRIAEIPAANEVLSIHSLARLQESGWFENVMAFNGSDTGMPTTSLPEPRREP